MQRIVSGAHRTAGAGAIVNREQSAVYKCSRGGCACLSNRQYGALTGVPARGHISAERHNRPSSGWHLSLLSLNGGVLGFPRAPPSAWGRFLVCYQSPLGCRSLSNPVEKKIFSFLKTGAERGWGTHGLAPRTGPQRGGGKPSMATGFAPRPAHKKRENPVTLAPQGIGPDLSVLWD